jgi:predicted molibdopterin-dependent oxidoreductase YjgC
MSEVRLQIDGTAVVVPEGTTVLEAARSAGIHIPTLCHHEQLEPYGGCRLCAVEAEVGDRTQLVVSCVFPVAENLVVRSSTAKVKRIRKTLVELLLARAPDSPPLVELAKELGADRDRFEKEASFCIHCGLCVRYCAEVVEKHAVGFVDRGPSKEICFVPEIAKQECKERLRLRRYRSRCPQSLRTSTLRGLVRIPRFRTVRSPRGRNWRSSFWVVLLGSNRS